MDIKLKIYDGSIYIGESRMVAEVKYKNIESYEVVTGKRADNISRVYGIKDENNEYLVITLENGETATFCNSHVDMFRI